MNKDSKRRGFTPPSRPTFSEKREIPAAQLLGELSRFCEEYLKAAVVLRIEGEPRRIATVSSEWLAYAVRLMVEKAHGTRAIYTTVKVGEHLVIDTDFKDIPLSLSDITDIAAAVRCAGLHFELRGTRVILRAALALSERLPIYARDNELFYTALYFAFFGNT